MLIVRQTVSRSFLAVAAVASLSVLVRAQDRSEVTINDTGTQAENLTSSQDGSVYFGSIAKGTIYRAAASIFRVRTMSSGSRKRPSGYREKGRF